MFRLILKKPLSGLLKTTNNNYHVHKIKTFFIKYSTDLDFTYFKESNKPKSLNGKKITIGFMVI